MEASAESEVSILDDSELKLPFMAHHANTQLVVMALQKAIEHIIDIHLSKNAFGKDTSDEELDWIHSLKPVVWCLCTLERTNSGRRVARPALLKLVKQHGDIIMECWTPNE